MQSDAEKSLEEMEIKIGFLERHIQEQDREIYAQSLRLDALQSALKSLAQKCEQGFSSQGASPLCDDAPANEKPPHY